MERLILSLLLLFCLAPALGEPITFTRLQEIFSEFNTSPFVNMLLIYDSAKPESSQLELVINQIARKRQGYYDTKLIDCNTNDEQVKKAFTYCESPIREQLPAIMFTEPSLNPSEDEALRESAHMRQYQGALDDRSLFNFAVPLMKAFSVELRSKRDYDKFMGSYPGTPKIIYFTDKEKIPPLYRALTAHFRHTIAFAHSFSKSTLAQQMPSIAEYPVFLLNGKDRITPKANLQEMIERFESIRGDPTTIEISQYQTSHIKQITTQEELEQLVYQLPEHTIVHVAGQDGSEHPEWSAIQKKFQKMFTLYESSLASELGVKNGPAIVYFPKSIVKKKVQKTVFLGKSSFEDIHNEIYEMIDDFTVTLSDGIEMQKHTGIHLQDDKFVAVLFHSESIPLPYKIISNDKSLQEEIAFFRMRNPDQQILAQYQIKKLPALIVMMIDKEAPQEPISNKDKEQGRMNMNLKLAAYTGKYTYQELYSYFSAFSKSAQEHLKKQSTSEHDELEVDSTTKLLKEVTSQSKLKSLCLKESCFLLLIDGKPENRQKNKEHLLALDAEAFKVASTPFVYVDAVCHSGLLAALEVMEDELPALIHIDGKTSKYARMVGRLEPKSINAFFGKIKAKRIMYRGYEQLRVGDQNCKEQHEKLKKLQESNAEISKEEAGILEELQAEQQKKREELKELAKGENVRKKNKKRRPKKEWENEEL